jgi:hypothetical protein
MIAGTAATYTMRTGRNILIIMMLLYVIRCSCILLFYIMGAVTFLRLPGCNEFRRRLLVAVVRALALLTLTPQVASSTSSDNIASFIAWIFRQQHQHQK